MTHAAYTLREEFYRGGGQRLQGGPYYFKEGEILWATIDAAFQQDGLTIRGVKLDPTKLTDSITHFLGSFDDYDVSLTSSGRVKFKIHNVTDLASGTRISDKFNIGVSLEEYRQNQNYQNQNKPLLSILQKKSSRSTLTTTGMGGGTMEQTFVWEEEYASWAACLKWFPPWPLGLAITKVFK